MLIRRHSRRSLGDTLPAFLVGTAFDPAVVQRNAVDSANRYIQIAADQNQANYEQAVADWQANGSQGPAPIPPPPTQLLTQQDYAAGKTTNSGGIWSPTAGTYVNIAPSATTPNVQNVQGTQTPTGVQYSPAPAYTYTPAPEPAPTTPAPAVTYNPVAVTPSTVAQPTTQNGTTISFSTTPGTPATGYQTYTDPVTGRTVVSTPLTQASSAASQAVTDIVSQAKALPTWVWVAAAAAVGLFLSQRKSR